MASVRRLIGSDFQRQNSARITTPGGNVLRGGVQIQLDQVDAYVCSALVLATESSAMTTTSQSPEDFSAIPGEPVVREVVCKTILNRGGRGDYPAAEDSLA